MVMVKDSVENQQLEEVEQQIIEGESRLSYYVSEYTLEYYSDKLENGEIVIPDYQRKDIWDDSTKTRFIESLLLGIPVPFLFLSLDRETGLLEIVDGSQRLRTIRDFLHDRLVLGPMKVITAGEGLRFSSLSMPRQRKLKNYSLRSIILEDGDSETLADLFDRINTSAEVAKPPEVRKGALSGPFQSLVQELAQTEPLVSMSPMSPRLANQGRREELVARFFAFQYDLSDYRDRVQDFIYTYTERMNLALTENPDIEKEMRETFANTMGYIDQAFPYGFRRKPDGNFTPNSRFEAIAIGSALALNSGREIIRDAQDIADFLESRQFKEVVRADGANAKSRLLGRINTVKDFLLGSDA